MNTGVRRRRARCEHAGAGGAVGRGQLEGARAPVRPRPPAVAARPRDSPGRAGSATAGAAPACRSACTGAALDGSASAPSEDQHRVAEGVEAVALLDGERGRAGASPRRPANAITSASSVERGRWKFVSRRSTRRNSKPGVTKSSVRPASGAPRASVSSDAHRRRADGEHALGAAAIRSHASGRDLVALAVERVLLERRRPRAAGTCRGRRAASRARRRAARAARA